MKHHLRNSLVLLFSVLALWSCNLSEKNRQYNQGDTVLQNSYWMLLSLQGQELQDNPETQTAYLRFEEGGQDLTGFTGCNRLRGKYSLSDSTLRFANLSTTRAMCPTIEQENFMMKMLEQVDTYRISGEVLTLFHKGTAVATFRAGSEPGTLPGDF